MTTQTTPLEIRLTDPYALKVSTAGGTPVLEVDTLTLSTKLSGRLLLNGIDIGARQQFFQGNILETPDLTVSSDGTTISLAVAGEAGCALTLIFADGHYVFAPASIDLTAGTDTVPQINYVYIDYTTKLLTVSTTTFPHTGQYIPVAKVIVQSAVQVAAQGALMVTSHAELITLAGRGHLSHINEWIHQNHSAWHSGVAQTLTITPQGAAPDNVDFATTAGIAFQIHSETLPVLDTAAGEHVHVVNDFTTPYTEVTDLNALLTDSANVAMNGRYFNLVIWASVSEDEDDCHLFLNLPSGSYVKQSDALADVSGYTNFSIPDAYRGAAILISRLTLRHRAAAGGTWTSIRETDLRGSIPNVIAGGGTQAITTEFADSTFRLFDETDPTKMLAFQLAGITAATLRTLTVQDAGLLRKYFIAGTSPLLALSNSALVTCLMPSALPSVIASENSEYSFDFSLSVS